MMAFRAPRCSRPRVPRGAGEEELRRGVDDGSFSADLDIDAVALALLSLGVDVARWYRPEADASPGSLGATYRKLALAMLGSSSPSPIEGDQAL
jgi:hypothetical protein